MIWKHPPTHLFFTDQFNHHLFLTFILLITQTLIVIQITLLLLFYYYFTTWDRIILYHYHVYTNIWSEHKPLKILKFIIVYRYKYQFNLNMYLLLIIL